MKKQTFVMKIRLQIPSKWFISKRFSLHNFRNIYGHVTYHCDNTADLELKLVTWCQSTLNLEEGLKYSNPIYVISLVVFEEAKRMTEITEMKGKNNFQYL